MRVLSLALCALQAVSSERDEHGMRQALRLARMRAPRERRSPGAGRAQGRTGGMRDFYGGANRTRLWPRTKHLQPLLPATPTEHLWAGGCCGLGHRTSRLMKLYVYAVSRGRHVVADWGACVGTPVANLFSALFGDWNELRAVRPRENQLRTPGCPSGVCPTGNKFKEAASHVDPSSRTSRPTTAAARYAESRASTLQARSGRASGASSIYILIFSSTRSILLHLW